MCEQKCDCKCCNHGCTCGKSSKGKKAVVATGLTAGIALSAYLTAKKMGLLDETIV